MYYICTTNDLGGRGVYFLVARPLKEKTDI